MAIASIPQILTFSLVVFISFFPSISTFQWFSSWLLILQSVYFSPSIFAMISADLGHRKILLLRIRIFSSKFSKIVEVIQSNLSWNAQICLYCVPWMFLSWKWPFFKDVFSFSLKTAVYKHVWNYNPSKTRVFELKLVYIRHIGKICDSIKSVRSFGWLDRWILSAEQSSSDSRLALPGSYSGLFTKFHSFTAGSLVLLYVID